MALLFTSFLAGILTIAAPCVLPMLPVIIGGSVADEDKKRPYIITASLSVSLVLFTLLLKATTLFLSVSTSFWAFISGAIVFLFGVITLFPKLWDRLEVLLGLGSGTTKLLQSSVQKKGIWGSILIGASLGPVFSSCSPTYSLIIATVLPQSFFKGLIYIIVYVLGLAIMLLLISALGQKFVTKLRWLSDPESGFKKALGILFIVVGLSVMLGYDKKLEAYLISEGIYKVPQVEIELIQNMPQN